MHITVYLSIPQYITVHLSMPRYTSVYHYTYSTPLWEVLAATLLQGGLGVAVLDATNLHTWGGGGYGQWLHPPALRVQ